MPAPGVRILRWTDGRELYSAALLTPGQAEDEKFLRKFGSDTGN